MSFHQWLSVTRSSLLCSPVQKALQMFSILIVLEYLHSLCSLLLKLRGTRV